MSAFPNFGDGLANLLLIASSSAAALWGKKRLQQLQVSTLVKEGIKINCQEW